MTQQNATININLVMRGSGAALNSTNSLTNSMRGFAGTTVSAMSSISGLASEFAKFSGVAYVMTGITNAISSIHTKTKELIVDLDKNLTQLHTLVNISREGVNVYAQEFINISNNTAQSLTNIGQGFQYIVSSGVQLKYAKSMLEETSKASVASFTNIDSLLDLITSSVNAFRRNMSGMSDDLITKQMLDQLFVLQKLSKITVKDASDYMGAVAAVAAEAGISFGEFAAAVGVTGNVMQADTAFVSFKQLVNSLISPTQQAKDILEKYGIAITQNMFKTKGLVAVLEELKRKIPTLDDLYNLFGDIRSKQAASSLFAEDMRQLKLFVKEMENSKGAMQEAFGKVTTASFFQFDLLKTKVSNIFTYVYSESYKTLGSISKILLETLDFKRLEEAFKIIGVALSEIISFMYKTFEFFNMIIQGIAGSLNLLVGTILKLVSMLSTSIHTIILNLSNNINSIFDTIFNKIAVISIHTMKLLSYMFKGSKETQTDLNMALSILESQYNDLSKTSELTSDLIRGKTNEDISYLTTLSQSFTEGSVKNLQSIQSSFNSIYKASLDPITLEQEIRRTPLKFLSQIKTLYDDIGVSIEKDIDIVTKFNELINAQKQGKQVGDKQLLGAVISAKSTITAAIKNQPIKPEIIKDNTAAMITDSEKAYIVYAQKLTKTLKNFMDNDVAIKSRVLVNSGNRLKEIMNQISTEHVRLIEELQNITNDHIKKMQDFAEERNAYRTSYEEKRTSIIKSFILTEEGKALQDLGMAQLYYSKAMQYSQNNNFKMAKDYMEKTVDIYRSLAENTNLKISDRNMYLSYFDSVSNEINNLMLQESDYEVGVFQAKKQELESEIALLESLYDEASNNFKTLKNLLLQLHTIARETLKVKIDHVSVAESVKELNQLIEQLETLHVQASKTFGLKIEGFTVKELKLPEPKTQIQFKPNEQPSERIYGKDSEYIGERRKIAEKKITYNIIDSVNNTINTIKDTFGSAFKKIQQEDTTEYQKDMSSLKVTSENISSKVETTNITNNVNITVSSKDAAKEIKKELNTYVTKEPRVENKKEMFNK